MYVTDLYIVNTCTHICIIIKKNITLLLTLLINILHTNVLTLGVTSTKVPNIQANIFWFVDESLQLV